MLHDFDPAIVVTPLGTAYWYGAVYSLGFIGILFWFWLRRSVRGMTNADTFTFTILFAVGVMLGGRVFDILVYELDYYLERPWAALNWWAGGMASHGVLLGGLIATVVFAKLRGHSVLALLDEVVVPGVFLLAVGRLGNFVEGGVVGSTTTMPWGFIYADLEGPRHPVALYESAKNFVILPILIWAIGKWEPGRGVVVSLFVFLYAGLRFAVDLFRDYEAAWLGIGTGQVFNLLMALAGLILLIRTIRHPRPLPPPPSPPARSVSWVQVAVLVFLIVYPLGIPTSWTRANINEKRQETPEEAQVSPIIRPFPVV